MEDYNNKTKAELLEIIQNLEKKVEQLSSESVSGRKERFRDRYSNRILDNLPDMLTVLDRDANIVELVSSPSTNHVEGTTADSITQSNIKDILPEDAYKNIRKNMEQVFRSGKSAIARHDLMMDGVPHHYEHWLSLLDKEYLLDTQKEPYGYACLTNDRKYYEENVPGLVVERAGIDEVILMMTGGKRK